MFCGDIISSEGTINVAEPFKCQRFWQPEIPETKSNMADMTNNYNVTQYMFRFLTHIITKEIKPIEQGKFNAM